MVISIMKTIEEEIKKVNDDVYCEIEYLGEFGNSIDVRIYGNGFVPVSEEILNRFLNNRTIMSNWVADEYTIDFPSRDEVKYCFSGHMFERIVIDLPNEIRDENLEKMIQVDIDYNGEYAL